MKWSKAKRVAIVASGPSLKAISPKLFLDPRLTVIAVNGAIEWLERADYWFTLDPSTINMVRARNPIAGVRYVMAVPDGFEVPAHVTALERVTGDLFDRVRAPGGLAESHDQIFTGNSAFGALGLAYHFKASRIGLFGVDGSQEERVTGGKPLSLSHLPALFETAVPQINKARLKVVNGSPDSAVTCFPRTSPKDAVTWLLS